MTTDQTPAPNRGGRPRTGTPVLVRIPDKVLAAIDRRATLTNRTRADVIREALSASHPAEPED